MAPYAMNRGDYDDRIRALELSDPSVSLPKIDAGWRRVFARLQPHTEPWAVLAYRPDDDRLFESAWHAHTVEIFDHGAGGPDAVRHDAGDLVVTPIAADADLPGLRTLAAAPHLETLLLRYRPHRRCTLRVSDGPTTYVVKVLADGRGQHFHRDALELWTAAQREELRFRVAEPCRWDADTRSVWQSLVAGVPIAAHLLGHEGSSIAVGIGEALGSLAVSTVEPSITCTSDAQLRRTRRAIEQAIQRVPELADDLASIADDLASRHAALSPDRLVPVHGAPHMHQWLIDECDGHRSLGLIDFDRFAHGEVELDIATLLAELDSEDELVQPVSVIEQHVIAGYRAYGVEIDHMRLQLYRAHKRLSKVTRVAWALRTDGQRRARRHLARVVECLEW